MEEKCGHVISMKETGQLKRSFDIMFDSDMVKKAIDSAVNVVKQHVVVKGYRKGKAPAGLIKNTFYPQVESVAMEMLANNGTLQGVFENKVQPLGEPICRDLMIHENGVFTCSVDLDIYPPINPSGYVGLELTPPSVDEDGLKKQIKHLIKQESMKEEKRNVVGSGYLVYLAYEVKEGEEVTHKHDNQPFIITDQQDPPFGKNLIGKREGDEIVENIVEQERKLEVSIKIGEIIERVEPTDEELDKLADGKLDEIIDYRFQLEKEQKIRNQLEEEIVDKLLKLHEFDLPEGWAADEEKYILQQFGLPEENDMKGQIKAMAERNVRRSFILDSIYNAEKSLAVTKEEIDAFVEEEAKLQEKDVKEFKKQILDNKLLDGVFSLIKNRKVFDFIISNSQPNKQEEQTDIPENPFE